MDPVEARARSLVTLAGQVEPDPHLVTSVTDDPRVAALDGRVHRAPRAELLEQLGSRRLRLLDRVDPRTESLQRRKQLRVETRMVHPPASLAGSDRIEAPGLARRAGAVRAR